MTSDQIWLRSELMGTQVITRDTGRRLGIVSEVLVDVDRREVVAVGLRDSILSRVVPGIPRYMYLENIRQIGDVILVDSDEVIEDIDPSPFSSLINSEVLTESNDLLGRVRSFKFNVETGLVEALVIGSVGVAFVPDQMLSTYELPVDEIVSSGPDRIIVFDGADEKLKQLTVGVLERLGIGAPPWEKDDGSYVLPTIDASNQLGTGIPTAKVTQKQDSFEQRLGKPAPQPQQEWSEDYYEEEPIRRQEPQRRYMEMNQDDRDDRAGWSEASGPDRYDERGYETDGRSGQARYDDRYDATYDANDEGGYGRDDYDNDSYYDDEVKAPAAAQQAPPMPEPAYENQDNLSGDAWSDESGKDVPQPEPLKMPEKKLEPEYEES